MEATAPTSERIADLLRTDIIEGVLRSDDRLKDQELATRFDVSRNTVREAIRLLVRDGLATSRLNSGATVRRLDIDDIHDIYEVRRTVECAAVLRSFDAPEELITQLTACVERSEEMDAQGNWSSVGTASVRFHQAIVGLTRSPLMDEFFSTILAQLRLAIAIMPDEAEYQKAWIPRDRDIHDLILDGKREHAARELKTYLDDSEARLVATLRAQSRKDTENRSR